MPRPDPAKRTPLWLQRLRAKDLLQVARQFPDFPIVVETYRECLDDDLDLPRLRGFLDAIQAGIDPGRPPPRRGPLADDLRADLRASRRPTSTQWDEPKRSDRKPASAVVDEDLLGPLLRDGMPPIPPGSTPRRSGGSTPGSGGRPGRRGTAEEMAEHLRLLGDLTDAELAGPMASFLAELQRAGRAVAIELPGTTEPRRWIAAEDQCRSIARRFPGGSHVLVGMG